MGKEERREGGEVGRREGWKCSFYSKAWVIRRREEVEGGGREGIGGRRGEHKKCRPNFKLVYVQVTMRLKHALPALVGGNSCVGNHVWETFQYLQWNYVQEKHALLWLLVNV